MEITKAAIPMSVSDIEVCMTESPHFRAVTAKLLVAAVGATMSMGDMKENLRAQIKRDFRGDQRIAAIKFVRQWAEDANFKELKSLKDAKDFVEETIPYYPL